MFVQISTMWSKFIIGSAYNYDGNHTGNPKYDIQSSIPNFTYAKYTKLIGPYYSLTYGAAALFAGVVSDKYQRKLLLTVMCLIWNITSFVNSAANNYTVLLFMRLIFGFASAFSSPICYSLIADYFPPERRTIANAFFTSSSFLGIAFSQLTNILVGSVGWRASYDICGIYGVFAILLFFIFVKEPERGRYDTKNAEVLLER